MDIGFQLGLCKSVNFRRNRGVWVCDYFARIAARRAVLLAKFFATWRCWLRLEQLGALWTQALAVVDGDE